MLSKIWHKVSHIGTTAVEEQAERRNIVLSNRFLILIFLINICLFFVIVSISGFGPFATMLILGNFTSFIIIFFLMWFGYNVVARIIFSWMVSIFTFATTLISKMDASIINDSAFYAPRFYILITAVIPVLIFTTRRKWDLTLSLSGSFLTLLLFDPIHNSLGLGYYQSGHTSPSYPFITFLTVAGFIIVITTLIIYKSTLEKYAREQRNLTASLTEKNTIIEQQKARLEMTNLELNEELTNKNKELLRSVSELKQFSYTLSHNLRSPVASLLGLTNLIDMKNVAIDADTKTILNHIKQSSVNLDETISDLRNIIDIRENINHTKESFKVADEIEKILIVLHSQIIDNKIEINLNSNAQKPIESYRGYIHSILYNLISNALKFRLHENHHIVDIEVNQINQQLAISVKDNGTGIDLEKYGGQLFKMYKRLNTHRPGKGLGLYITHYQVEHLGGSIDVTSEPGKGSQFIVKIPI